MFRVHRMRRHVERLFAMVVRCDILRDDVHDVNNNLLSNAVGRFQLEAERSQAVREEQIDSERRASCLQLWPQRAAGCMKVCNGADAKQVWNIAVASGLDKRGYTRRKAVTA